MFYVFVCFFAVATAHFRPREGAIAPRASRLRRSGGAPNWTCCAHLLATRENTRVCLDCLVSHSTRLIKLLLHSRWDAVHLFNSTHHKERWRDGLTKGGGQWVQ